MNIVHKSGKYITAGEKADNPYLMGKMSVHTLCGYLLDDTEENLKRVSSKSEDVTCKMCTKLANSKKLQ